MYTNELSVQIVTSCECDIKEINDRKILQESEVFIGIVNKSEALFDRRSGLHYYWINAGLDNG